MCCGKSKKVLVIGAGSYSKRNSSIKGIGTCLVEAFANNGADVLFTYNESFEGAQRLVKEIEAGNPTTTIRSLYFNALDCRVGWESLKKQLKKFGIPDIFVYNSGLRYYKLNQSKEEKSKTFKVNYECPIFLLDKICKIMRTNHQGKMIFISSILAGKEHPFLQVYADSKYKMSEYVKGKAREYSKAGLEIIVVSPTFTKTPMTEERITKYERLANEGKIRLKKAEEVAQDILRMC